MRSHASNVWFKKPGGDFGVVGYKGNASVSECLHRGDRGASGQGNGGRTTQRVAAEALLSVAEGLRGAVHDGLEQSIVTWPVAVFRRKAWQWLLHQPVSLKAKANSGWRLAVVECRRSSGPPQLGQRGAASSARVGGTVGPLGRSMRARIVSMGTAELAERKP